MRACVGKRINLRDGGIYSFDLETGEYDEYDVAKLSEEEYEILNTPRFYDACRYIITSDEIIAHASFFISEMVKNRYTADHVDKTRQHHKKAKDKNRRFDRSAKYDAMI
jgi:hypothetical protein